MLGTTKAKISIGIILFLLVLSSISFVSSINQDVQIQAKNMRLFTSYCESALFSLNITQLLCTVPNTDGIFFKSNIRSINEQKEIKLDVNTPLVIQVNLRNLNKRNLDPYTVCVYTTLPSFSNVELPEGYNEKTEPLSCFYNVSNKLPHHTGVIGFVEENKTYEFKVWLLPPITNTTITTIEDLMSNKDYIVTSKEIKGVEHEG